MSFIKRQLQDEIEKHLFKGKIIIIYGARQVGKTTLVKEIQKKYEADAGYLNCDEPDIRLALTDKSSTEIKAFLGSKKLIIIDEAQRVKNIGLTLKLIADNFSAVQVIATGSSSFDLSNEITEPLTGRKYEFYLYPFSIEELRSIYSDLEIHRILERRMIFGMYPEIALTDGDIAEKVKNIANSYLYKDVLQYQNIKNPDILHRLLSALALQIGSEVSYNELAATTGIDKTTAANYIQILEKAFVIFKLQPFSRNLRNELKKMRKIYFYDTGIRNGLINNFNRLDLRADVGALWENFLISERLKYNNNHQQNRNFYFWRTHQQKEIDYIEEYEGKIEGYEFKWGSGKFSAPKDFLAAYKNSTVQVITKENYQTFLS